MEHHDVVDAVDELRAEVLGDDLHHRGLHARVVLLAGVLLDDLRAEVRGHDHDRVAEVDRAALAVGETPVVEHLQQDVEDVRVRLLDLVEQDHGVGPAAHRLGEIAALLVADIARRRADEPRHGVLLHELRHVDAHHRLLGVEQELGERLAELGLADTRRSEEQERTVRPARIGETGARAADGVRDDAHGLLLADDAPRQRVLHAQELLLLALEHLGDRDAGPLRDDLGDLLVGDAVAHELRGRALGGLRCGDALLEFGDAAVLQLGHLRKIAPATRGIELELHLLELVLHGGCALQRGLLGLPDLLEVGVFLLEAREGLLERGEPLARRLVLLLLQRDLLDLELDDAPLELVERLGLGVDLHADARGRLVDEVDGLVGQLAVGDVAVRERRRGDDRRVGDVDAVVHLVALLQAAQDGDGVLDRGLVDQHLLEAPLERRVLLDVLAVFVERGRADAVQLAARERGLQHVAGVHRALGLAGADHGVQLVDEQDHLPFLLREVVEHRLQALLELAAELGAGDQRAHVEREDALAAQRLRHLAVDDAQREALDDGGLADAGLADQHRIVLGATLQHLDGAADLVVAADDGVELAVGGALGEVDGVLLERLPALLGVRVLHGLAAAQLVDGLLDGGARAAGIFEQPREQAAVLEGREQEVLARDVLVAALLRELVGDVEQALQVVRDMHLAGAALDLRQLVERGDEVGAQPCDVAARLLQHRARPAALLLEQGEQHVGRLDDLVVAPERERLGLGEGLLEAGGQLVLSHAPEDGAGTRRFKGVGAPKGATGVGAPKGATGVGAPSGRATRRTSPRPRRWRSRRPGRGSRAGRCGGAAQG